MVLPELVQMTVEHFADFVHQPENADRVFELINGQVVEVLPGRSSYSEIGHNIVFHVRLFCRDHNLPCHTSGGDGTYLIQGNVIAPDFAYKPTPMSDDYPDPDSPLFAVEVISPTDKASDIRNKRKVYLDAGILLWEVYKPSLSVDVFAPGQPVRTFGIDDTLDGGDVLAGFKMSVKDLFGIA